MQIRHFSEISTLLSVKSKISSDILSLSQNLVLVIYSDYETMGNCLPTWEEDVTALTLWHRVQKCIESLPTALCDVLGFSVSEIGQLIVTDSEMRNNFEIMVKALGRQATRKAHNRKHILDMC